MVSLLVTCLAGAAWRPARRHPRILVPASLAVAVVIAKSLVGATVVIYEL
jgi:heme A synthase